VIAKIKTLFAWLQKYERHVSTVVFVCGTTSDIITLTRVTISYAVTLLAIYLSVAAIATIVEHHLYVHDSEEGAFLRGVRLTSAFVSEFLIGCLLSGCLVFYTRTAAITASWPFVLLLIFVLFGNEFLRDYKERLAFRMTLLFFTLYAYFIFTLPTLLHHISPQTFIESSFVTVGVFAIFMIALAFAGWKRFVQSLWEILLGVGAVLIIVNASYFTGIIPPLPLALKDVGEYHSIAYTTAASGAVYEAQAEVSTDPWWDVGNFIPTTVHIVPGDSLSVFSSVFAPTEFTTAIIHKWDLYNSKTRTWQTKAEIAFGITGGRDGGYRGYSILPNVTPGLYRVSIETLSGQVIGRTYFTVVYTKTEPALHTETY
jgi:hypothetical protein